MPVQINGRVKCTIVLPREISREDALAAAFAEERVKISMEGRNLVKTIVVPGKIINIVVK